MKPIDIKEELLKDLLTKLDPKLLREVTEAIGKGSKLDKAEKEFMKLNAVHAFLVEACTINKNLRKGYGAFADYKRRGLFIKLKPLFKAYKLYCTEKNYLLMGMNEFRLTLLDTRYIVPRFYSPFHYYNITLRSVNIMPRVLV